MTRKQMTAFRMDAALLDAMRDFKETQGIPVTTQLEMAVREWLQKRGVIVKKAGRKRVSARKRP